MADAILDQIRDVVEGQIDFKGQALCESISTCILGGSGILAFVLGYVLQDIKLALYVGLGGMGLTFLAVVPPWPIYKQHPVRWYHGPSAIKSDGLRYIGEESTDGVR